MPQTLATLIGYIMLATAPAWAQAAPAPTARRRISMAVDHSDRCGACRRDLVVHEPNPRPARLAWPQMKRAGATADVTAPRLFAWKREFWTHGSEASGAARFRPELRLRLWRMLR
jgi:hypothetical protein